MALTLRIFTEPQLGATYDDQLAVAREAEALGFGAFFRSDHYLGIMGDGLPGPTDAWVTLAGLARDTSTIRLGTLMTSVTFRYPGPLAISVAQVDQMSGGRVELGLGAGWFEDEHRAYGIPFPDNQERFDRLEESLELITGMWSTPLGERFHHDGRYYPVTDSPALPKPVQSPRPRLLSGMRSEAGLRRTAERFDIWNPASGTLEQILETAGRLQEQRPADRAPLEVYWRLFVEPPVLVANLRPVAVDELVESVAQAKQAGIASVIVDANFDTTIDSPQAWAELPRRLAPLVDAAR